MYKSISLNQPWSYLFTLQVLMAMLVLMLHQGTVNANAIKPEIPAVSDNENEYLEDNDDGFWRKREANFNGALIENGQTLPLVALFVNPETVEQLASYDNNNIMDDISAQKRAWKAKNSAWGKGAGTWGKREPNWNNLKGMWGKRSAAYKGEQWERMKGSWGKRSAHFPEMN